MNMGGMRMREILFRGKRKDDGEWVEGYFLKSIFFEDDAQHDIIATKDNGLYYSTGDFYDFWEVIPETVGQYTGFKDKKGRLIFEGDIILLKAYGDKYVGEVKFVDGIFGVSCKFYTAQIGYAVINCKPIVIGNIHDNFELLNTDK